MQPIILCRQCSAPLHVYPYQLKRGKGKFCSRSCLYLWLATDPTLCKDIAVRFWSFVQKTDTCWLWTGAKNNMGYGRLKLSRSTKTYIFAHRLSWELHYGLIFDGIHVLHHCDTPLCVNPAHLFLGTQYDNLQDCMTKGRRNDTNHVKGSAHGCAILTESQVIEMRTLQGNRPAKEVAQLYNISISSVRTIWRREQWKHI